MALMRTATLLVALWTLPSPLTAINIDCNLIRVDSTSFDISPLAGPHSVIELIQTPVAIKNITYTIDVCRPLGRSSDKEKAEECPSDSRVCALERVYREDTKDEPLPDDVWPIAGEFIHDGRTLDPTVTRLKSSDSHADAEKEGLRIEMNGGIHEGMKQKVLLELICDQSKTGLEGEAAPEEASKRRRRAENEDGGKEDDEEKPEDGEEKPEEPLPDPNAAKSLKFRSYRVESSGNDDFGVLRLEWFTKYACEDQKSIDDKDPESDTPSANAGWGVFTWFIIILFLGVASYLIFGSYLNYSRYGARGWDLLPHGDTVRDLPYLLRDWCRRVVSTIQGGGSGRGYSAI